MRETKEAWAGIALMLIVVLTVIVPSALASPVEKRNRTFGGVSHDPRGSGRLTSDGGFPRTPTALAAICFWSRPTPNPAPSSGTGPTDETPHGPQEGCSPDQGRRLHCRRLHQVPGYRQHRCLADQGGRSSGKGALEQGPTKSKELKRPHRFRWLQMRVSSEAWLVKVGSCEPTSQVAKFGANGILE
jgi:hypothetical protein